VLAGLGAGLPPKLSAVVGLTSVSVTTVGAVEVMQEIASHYELKRYTPEITLADGDRAACLANVAFEQRATGRTLTFKIADFLRFEDNRLIEFRELSDTFDLTQQALGRWLKL
jgi:ketosteroid isomerase-like protein